MPRTTGPQAHLLVRLGLLVHYMLILLLSIFAWFTLALHGAWRYRWQMSAAIAKTTSAWKSGSPQLAGRSVRKVSLIISEDWCRDTSICQTIPRYVAQLVESGVAVVFIYDTKGWLKLRHSTFRQALAKGGVRSRLQLGFRGEAVLHIESQLDDQAVPLIVLLDRSDSRETFPAALARETAKQRQAMFSFSGSMEPANITSISVSQRWACVPQFQVQSANLRLDGLAAGQRQTQQPRKKLDHTKGSRSTAQQSLTSSKSSPPQYAKPSSSVASKSQVQCLLSCVNVDRRKQSNQAPQNGFVCSPASKQNEGHVQLRIRYINSENWENGSRSDNAGNLLESQVTPSNGRIDNEVSRSSSVQTSLQSASQALGCQLQQSSHKFSQISTHLVDHVGHVDAEMASVGKGNAQYRGGTDEARGMQHASSSTGEVKARCEKTRAVERMDQGSGQHCKTTGEARGMQHVVLSLGQQVSEGQNARVVLHLDLDDGDTGDVGWRARVSLHVIKGTGLGECQGQSSQPVAAATQLPEDGGTVSGETSFGGWGPVRNVDSKLAAMKTESKNSMVAVQPSQGGMVASENTAPEFPLQFQQSGCQPTTPRLWGGQSSGQEANETKTSGPEVHVKGGIASKDAQVQPAVEPGQDAATSSYSCDGRTRVAENKDCAKQMDLLQIPCNSLAQAALGGPFAGNHVRATSPDSMQLRDSSAASNTLPERVYTLPGQLPLPTGDPRTLTSRLLKQRAALLTDAGFPAAAIEPDFVVVVGGRVLRTWGYPPWQLRLCEVYWVPGGLEGLWLDWCGMGAFIRRYEGTNMRLGR